ncbi:MAG: carboxypeptidase regulatory-like domain-containing protein [Planctomycetes bacterium]|nr:carboxypeptidase regulatory-like domain-containing protein [Planctomycetota bacterium]
MNRPLLASAAIAAALILAALVAVRWLRPPGEKGPAPASQAAPAGGAGPAAAPSAESPAQAAAAQAIAPAAEEAPSAWGPAPGKVSGRVVRADTRAPLEGAFVQAALGARAASSGEDLPWREAVTGPDGAFELDLLAPAPWSLRASLSGFLDRRVEPVLPGDAVEVALSPDAGVPCRVELERDEDSVPLADQEVFLRDLDGPWSLEARTDARGAFRITGLPADELEAVRRDGRIDVVVPGYAEPAIERSRSDGGYVITAEAGATVVGTVTDAAGRPIAGAAVHAGSGHEAPCDARGAFRIGGVTEALTAYAPGHAPETKELDDEEPVETVRIDFRLGAGLTLRGRVLDGKSRPLPAVALRVVAEDIDVESPSETLARRLAELLSTTSDDEGRYRLRGLPAEALELPGVLELEVRPPGAAASWTVEVDVDAEEGEVERDIVLDLAEPVRGVVLAPDGRPVPRAVLLATSATEGLTAATASDGAGRFELRSLPAGFYRLRVEAAGRPVGFQELKAPSPPLEVRLGVLETVAGMVRAADDGEPLPGIRVSLQPSDAGEDPLPGAAVSDAAGRFSLGQVPRGRFLLVAMPEQQAPAFSRLQRSTRLEIEVGEGGWSGEAAYPVHPSGEVELRFAVSEPGGGSAPAAGRVRVAVVSYQLASGRDAPGGSIEPPVAGAEEGFRARWRAGKYRLRCALDHAGRELVKDEDVTIEPGGRVERTVVFPRSP